MRLARRDLGMVIGILMFVLFGAVGLFAQTLDTSLWSGMNWRSIGPFRCGRVETVVGIPGNPDVYYFGAVAGGVWKTTDAGRSWHPMFDKEPIASIGAIAIDPRDHNVVYVGTGEPCLRGNISFGNGMYKSLDGGHTWTHIGLDDTRHISKVLIDPQDPNTIFVAAIGHAYGPNEQRGVFRSTDAGKFFIRMTRRAPLIWFSIRQIRTFCTRRCIRKFARRGVSPAADPAAGFINPKTAVRPGNSSPLMDCRREFAGALVWRWARIRIACMR